MGCLRDHKCRIILIRLTKWQAEKVRSREIKNDHFFITDKMAEFFCIFFCKIFGQSKKKQ